MNDTISLEKEIEKLKAKNDEAHLYILRLICERDKHQMRADSKWALRKELEKELGLDGTETNEKSLEVALATIRGLKKRLDQSLEKLAKIVASNRYTYIVEHDPDGYGDHYPELDVNGEYLDWKKTMDIISEGMA